MNKTYLSIADKHFADMLTANMTEPYNHDEYTRHLNMARAACLLLCEGDYNLAAALVDAFHESNEAMAWYVTQYTREQLLDYAHINESSKEINSNLQFRTN